MKKLLSLLVSLVTASALFGQDPTIVVSGPTQVVAGEDYVFDVSVVNLGGAVAASVEVDAVLPLNIGFSGDSLNACTVAIAPADGQRTVTCTLGDIAAGGSIAFQIRAPVFPWFSRDGGPTGFTISATVSATVDTNGANNEDSTSPVLVDVEADLRLTTVLYPDTGTVPAGEQFTIVMLADNLGPSTAESIEVLTTVSSSDFVRANGCSIAVRTDGGFIDEFDCNFALSTGVFDIGTFGSNWLNPRGSHCEWNAGADPGEEEFCDPPSQKDLGRIIITINATADTEGTFEEISTLQSDTYDPDTSNNISSDVLGIDAVADLELQKVAGPDVAPGEFATWTLTVLNHGPSHAAEVVVEDFIPNGLIEGTITVTGEIEDSNGPTTYPIGCTTGVPGDPSAPAVCALGGLPPMSLGWSAEITVSGLVDPDFLIDRQGIPGPHGITNNASVSTDTIEANFTDDGIPSNPNDPDPPGPEEPNHANATVVVSLDAVDYFTELFGPGEIDLASTTLEIRPILGGGAYEACQPTTGAEFVVADGSEIPLVLGDDDFKTVFLSGGKEVRFYGVKHSSVYVGSNGYVSFGSGDTEYWPTLEHHFDLARLSASFSDLDPSLGGDVWWMQLADRLVVTWDAVPYVDPVLGNQTVQVQMFFGGKIQVLFGDLSDGAALTGLSPGNGVPFPFEQSDLSMDYGLCPEIFSDAFESGDIFAWSDSMP